MNYRLYHLAAGHILTAELSGNYGDEWLESNVCEEYKSLTAQQIEDKIQELYELLQVSYDMGIDFQRSEEERRFHYQNGGRDYDV